MHHYKGVVCTNRTLKWKNVTCYFMKEEETDIVANLISE